MRYLLVGLGNMEDAYTNTRHNIGFRVLNVLSQLRDVQFQPKKLGHFASFRESSHTVFMLKPSTYMNASGKAVDYWLSYLKLALTGLLVAVDDLNLPVGVVKFKTTGSSGGHNGLRSIEEAVHTQAYARIRIGIGRNFLPGSQAAYVLSPPTGEEEPLIELACKQAAQQLLTFIQTNPYT